MNDYKELALGLLQVQTKKTDEDLASLLENEDGTLKENALELLKQIDAERVSKLRMSEEERQKIFDDGYSKAKKQSMTSFEKSLKEQYSINSDAMGLDLIAEVIAANKPDGNQQNADFTDENIRKSKFYIDREEEWKNQIAQTNADWEKKFNDQQNELKYKQTFSKVKTDALAIINSLNPVLSSDANKAMNQKQVILNELTNYSFDQQGDRVVVLKKDGSVLEDAHGNRVDFNELVKGITTNYYDLKVGEQRQTAGGSSSNGNSQAQGNGYAFKVPQSSEEYIKLMSENAGNSEMEIQITKAWTEFKASR